MGEVKPMVPGARTMGKVLFVALPGEGRASLQGVAEQGVDPQGEADTAVELEQPRNQEQSMTPTQAAGRETTMGMYRRRLEPEEGGARGEQPLTE